jgi:hypothetical protein
MQEICQGEISLVCSVGDISQNLIGGATVAAMDHAIESASWHT